MRHLLKDLNARVKHVKTKAQINGANSALPEQVNLLDTAPPVGRRPSSLKLHQKAKSVLFSENDFTFKQIMEIQIPTYLQCPKRSEVSRLYDIYVISHHDGYPTPQIQLRKRTQYNKFMNPNGVSRAAPVLSASVYLFQAGSFHGRPDNILLRVSVDAQPASC